MPLAIDPIACSRTPKWRWRPSGVSRWNEPAVLTRVFVDGARSASPPTRCGRRGETAASTAPLASRVATGVSGGNVGRSRSQPGVRVRACPFAHSAARSGNARCQASNRACQSASARAPCASASRNRRSAGSGRRNGGSSGHPSACFAPRSSASPSGSPWASRRPGLLRRAVADDGPHGDEGRPPRLGLARPGWPSSIAARSLPSGTACVCQPSPSNRRGTSSEKDSDALPASETMVVVVERRSACRARGAPRATTPPRQRPPSGRRPSTARRCGGRRPCGPGG